MFADRDTPPPSVRDPRVWERTLGIVRARDAFLTSEGRFKTFQEVLGPWTARVASAGPEDVPKGFRKRNGFAELNGGGGLEPMSTATTRAKKEWAAIVSALDSSHGSSLRALGTLPEAGALVAWRAGRVQPHGGKWFYGQLEGPVAGDPGASQVLKIALGPNGLQAPHSTPGPLAVQNSFLHGVAMAATALGPCILGPVSCTFPHPETWILAKRGAKLNPKSLPFLHSRRIRHMYSATQKNACHAPASEKKWAAVLASASTHQVPPLKWPLIYRGTHPALLTPADSHQLSKMVHRGIFTNAALPTEEERGCRLGCGHIRNPVEHMSHLALCRRTSKVRLWALQLIAAVDELPALPWAHGLVPFFCLGLAPPPECKEDCRGAAGCTCLAPLSAGGYTVLALALRYLYAGLTRLAIEDLPKLIQAEVIKAAAEALRDRISSFFALTKRRLVSARNRDQDLDIAKVVERAAGSLLTADSVSLAVHPAVHLALQDAGVVMPRVLRWAYAPPIADPPGPPEEVEATQLGPEAAPPSSAGAEEATQRGREAGVESGEVRPRPGEGGQGPEGQGTGPGAAGPKGNADEASLRAADDAARNLLSRSPPRSPAPPRRSPGQAPRRHPPPTPTTPDQGQEPGAPPSQAPPDTSGGRVTPHPRRKRRRPQQVVTTPDEPAPTATPTTPDQGPEPRALTSLHSPGVAEAGTTPQLRRKHQRRQRIDTTPDDPPTANRSQPYHPNGPVSPAPTPTPTPGRRRKRSPGPGGEGDLGEDWLSRGDWQAEEETAARGRQERQPQPQQQPQPQLQPQPQPQPQPHPQPQPQPRPQPRPQPQPPPPPPPPPQPQPQPRPQPQPQPQPQPHPNPHPNPTLTQTQPSPGGSRSTSRNASSLPC